MSHYNETRAVCCAARAATSIVLASCVKSVSYMADRSGMSRSTRARLRLRVNPKWAL